LHGNDIGLFEELPTDEGYERSGKTSMRMIAASFGVGNSRIMYS